jgi:hypothetical protein
MCQYRRNCLAKNFRQYWPPLPVFCFVSKETETTELLELKNKTSPQSLFPEATLSASNGKIGNNINIIYYFEIEVQDRIYYIQGGLLAHSAI